MLITADGANRAHDICREFALSPDAPVTYREFKEFMQRVDDRQEKLDTEKADVKDVDVLANMVRQLSDEVAGLRKVLIGFMVSIALGAVVYSFATFQLLAGGNHQTQERTK